MKGYFAFVLVFASVLLILVLISSTTTSTDLSKALAIERAYSLSMNVKEVITETALQGAMTGFALYDQTHDLKMCIHCPDHFCSYDHDRPNYCDDLLCYLCFREDQARLSAETIANSDLSALEKYEFDEGFSVMISDPQLSVVLKPNQLAKNGLSPDTLKFNKMELILVSDFIMANSTFPEMVIQFH